MSEQTNSILLAIHRLLGGESPKSTPFWQYIIAFLVLFAAIIGAFVAWRKYSDRVLIKPAFQLATDKVQLTEPPPWISKDRIKQDVFELHQSLPTMKLNAPDLTERLHDAFEMHPWIEKVKYVGKTYGRVVVDVQFRDPVAVVEFTHNLGFCVLPVDRIGRILPGKDFPRDLALNGFLRISLENPEPYPTNNEGQQWGDERVHDCARIAALLRPLREKYELHSIASDQDRTISDGRSYLIRTRSGATIHWGRAPGEEWRNEPTAEQKMRRLTTLLSSRQPLDANTKIDVRLPLGNSITLPSSRARINPISTSPNPGAPLD
jgi:hypothetical protein